MTSTEPKVGLKRRVLNELLEYWALATYFAVVLASFSVYRQLLLGEGASPYQYGANIVEGLVLGKIVMIGEYLRLGTKLNDRALVVPTLYRTAAFMMLVVFFKVCEHWVVGLFRHEAMSELFGKRLHDWREIAGHGLVVFVAFLPFFAVRELERVLGKGILSNLFFKRRFAPTPIVIDVEGVAPHAPIQRLPPSP